MSNRLALLAAAVAAAVVHAQTPSRVTFRALNQSDAVINMTDDVSFGTLSWSPKRQFLFDDDVKVARITAENVNNAAIDNLVAKVEKVVACNRQQMIYDQAIDRCAVVASAHHNTKVRETVTGCSYMFCLIMWDNNLRCWGYNGGYGQLGFGGTTDRYMPINSAVTAGNYKLQTRRMQHLLPMGHTYHNMGAVLADGSVWMTGYNGHGTLGFGSTSNRYYWMKANNLVNVTAIRAGGQSTEPTYCAIQGDGKLYCWGYNNYGQCGIGHTSSVLTPTKIDALNNVRMVDICRSSSSTTCAVTYDGKAWCWGYNGYGQLANGGTQNRDSPTVVSKSGGGFLDTAVVIKMHGGGSVISTFAITSDGQLWGWGYSGHGQTGTGTTSNVMLATKVKDGSNNMLNQVNKIEPCNGSRYGPICALRNDGSVWCWGYNNHGQLGLGHTSSRNVANKVTFTGDDDVIMQIENPPMIDHSYAYHSVCVLTKNTRATWCWGYNNYGQLGQGDTSQRNSPVKVRNVGRGSQLGSRAYHASNGDTTFYTVSEDGYNVWGWGYGGHMQPGAHTWTIGTNDIPQKVRLM